MSVRRADARFLLPRHPASALVLGELDGWRAALAEAGVRDAKDRAAPDLVVAPGRMADAARATNAGCLILEGAAPRVPGYRITRWAAVPTIAAPEVLVPLSHRAAARYAVVRWIRPDARWKAARNRALASLAARGTWPERASVITVAAREPGPPFFLAATADLGVRADGAFATLGGADDLARGVFHVFSPGSSDPDRIVKFARVRDYEEPFDLDERGLGLAGDVGGVVARHAPRLLGRTQVDGMHASVETAASGERLVNFLKAPGPRGRKLQAVERVAAWLVDVAGETVAEPSALDPERARLTREVVPRWTALAIPEDLVERTERVGAVFRRGDLGSWNIVTAQSSFTAVDWETAREHGFPLWDLLYFLTDALALLDGAWEGRARDEYVGRLLRGEERSSLVLFEWVRRAVAASPIEPDAVGPVVTLLWLSIGVAHARRAATIERAAPGSRAVVPPAERVAAFWMADPLLGPGWDRWRR